MGTSSEENVTTSCSTLSSKMRKLSGSRPVTRRLKGSVTVALISARSTSSLTPLWVLTTTPGVSLRTSSASLGDSFALLGAVLAALLAATVATAGVSRGVLRGTSAGVLSAPGDDCGISDAAALKGKARKAAKKRQAKHRRAREGVAGRLRRSNNRE